ncbi:MAG: RNA polymerase sigma factor [Planctomycetota bacterium]
MSNIVNDRQKKVLELLDTSGVRLHAMLARLTLSEEVVGDLMQELFIRLSNSSGLDKANNSFAYAYRAAINLAFEWRKKSKVKFQPLDEDCLPAENNPSPLAEMVQAEELAQILDVMPRLNRLAREVVVMHYIEQGSYEEIALRLGKKPQHIRSVSAKALARLRYLLTDEKSKSGSKE